MIDFSNIKSYCLSKYGAYETYPFGPFPVCYKVCNRIFIEWYPDDSKITVRCEPVLADFYRQAYPGLVMVGYHCPDRQKPYKNTVFLNTGMSDDLIFDMIDHSYEEAVKRLSKKDRIALESETGKF